MHGKEKIPSIYLAQVPCWIYVSSTFLGRHGAEAENNLDILYLNKFIKGTG